MAKQYLSTPHAAGYRVSREGDEIWVIDPISYPIANINQHCEDPHATGQEIATALNGHDDLVAVCKRLLREVKLGGASATAIRAMTDDAEAALLKAGAPVNEANPRVAEGKLPRP